MNAIEKIMASMLFSIFFFIIPIIGHCMVIGNPAQPALQKKGIFWVEPKGFSFRVAYLQDYVYKQLFQEELQFDACTVSSDRLKLWTQGAMLTANLKDHLDVYGILGGQRLEINKDVITKQQFSWGIGGKLVFFHKGNFRAGCDLKYLKSDQKPCFFQCDHLAYNVTSNFLFNYSEIQAALGLSYKTKHFSPYANASYLISKLRAVPPSVTVRLPMQNIEVDVNAKSIIGRDRFGMALGATVTDRKRASLSLEWRSFNQNAIDISGDLRF